MAILYAGSGHKMLVFLEIKNLLQDCWMPENLGILGIVS